MLDGQLPTGWRWRWRDGGRYGELLDDGGRVIAYMAYTAPDCWEWAVAQQPPSGSAETRDEARISAETAVMGRRPYGPHKIWATP